MTGRPPHARCGSIQCAECFPSLGAARGDARKRNLAELHTAADTARATFNAAGIPGYFIADDSWGDTWIWAERDARPVPVIGRSTFDAAPDLWAAIVTLVGGGSR